MLGGMPFRKLSCALCEIRWILGSLRLRVSSGHSSSLVPESSLLRRLLRKTPWWINGHLRLGFTELAYQLRGDEKPDPQRVEVIRLSALAVLTLAGRGVAAGSGLSSRRILEARYLLAMTSFFKKRFDEALRELEKLLVPEERSKLSVDVVVGVLEHAGASAMALEKRTDALRYFQAIPERLRSSESRTAIEYLGRHLG